jgi:hypothetical protein
MTVSLPAERDAARRLRRIGLWMAAIILGYGLFIAALPFLLANQEPTPPWALYRPIGLLVLFSIPAAVAAIGAIRGVRPLLVAAGVLCLLQAFVSFSGVTFGFLVPAFVLIWLGASAPSKGAGSNRAGMLAGVLIVGLTLAAWVSLFALTEPRCYSFTKAADGAIVYTEVPATDLNLNGPVEIVGEGGGCSSAEITLRGLGVSGVLAIGAVVLAASVAPSGRRRDPAGSTSEARP